jgi:hypothetical protein
LPEESVGGARQTLSEAAPQTYEACRPWALWQAAQRAELFPLANELCPKRAQGLSVGTYLAVASVNQAVRPVSKRQLWEWLAKTVLVHQVPGVSAEAYQSQFLIEEILQ